MIYVGTAGWSVPKIAAESFPQEGTHLDKYAAVLNAVEINSSFYRDHQAKTYKKWADATPEHFKFSVKLNKRFTHSKDFEFDADDLKECLTGIKGLGDKWGVLLIQFSAGKKFNTKRVEILYKNVRKVFKGHVALEARNLQWMSEESLELMKKYNISKVTADPEKCLGEVDGSIQYYRLHGSPLIYKSDYTTEYLNELYKEMKEHDGDVWCIFDNTQYGHATNNAVAILNKGEPYERHQRFHGSETNSMHALNEH